MAAKSTHRGRSPRPPVNGAATGGTVPPEMIQSSPNKPPHPSYDYTSYGVTDNSIFKLKSSDWQVVGAITLIGLFVRLFRIYQPTSVVFDEVHFGGFASKYIKGKFFMDVHPPLAKMLITLAGYLGGFNGNFDFKDIGLEYNEHGVPYVSMRLFPALCGVLSIPTMYLTLRAAGCRIISATLGALLLTFENGFITQSRLILLDSPLVIFTAFTALSWFSFTNQHELGPRAAFKPTWWFWLAATGVSLGATASVKWVGLFTIAWVGSLTALQLWVLLGDSKNVTPRIWFKHLLARVFCLIIIPLTFYMAMFAIHFVCLVNPGDGDGFMSSEFQSTLNSKGMADVAADVAFGSRISIRHHNTQGGYLHSHAHMYPAGSKQQQVTLYPHKDENNVFLIENQTQPINWAVDPTGNTSIPGPNAWDGVEPSNIIDGSVIRLYHSPTNRRIHSHDVRAPMSEADWQNEVSCYGYEGFEGDANDLFKVEIVKSLSDGKAAKERLRTIETKFKLIHIMTGCALFSHKVKLPDWGFEQQEVTCARGGTVPNSIWYVESNVHPNMKPDVEKVNYRNPGFFSKFWELNRVMWTTNAGLVESHAWDSRPPSWPVLRRGINFWGKNNRQIYLIGNPVIWWTSTAAIAVYVLFKALTVLRWQRSMSDYKYAAFRRFDYELGTSVLGWAFHYFPFYLMARQLFLHHYFPALYFAIINLSQLFDFVFNRIQIGSITLKNKPIVGQSAAVAFLALSIAAFTLYAPLTYGNQWTRADCNRVKLFETWDFDCNTFFENYSDYSREVLVPNSAAQVTGQAAQGPAPPVADDPRQEVAVTPQRPPINIYNDAEADAAGVSVEERVEYRDQNGNLLDEAQVRALEGDAGVEFSTRYETRTRLVDQNGNEVDVDNISPDPVPEPVIADPAIVPQGSDKQDDTTAAAGTRADAPEPETGNNDAGRQPEPNTAPPHNEADADLVKEERVREAEANPTPEPESDADRKTKGEL